MTPVEPELRPAQARPAAPPTTDGIDAMGEGRVLDPIDRISEILFGLFMVLTFTGTLSVASAGREDVRLMLIAAIGCNTAWGFVDAVMYVLRNLVSRGREAVLERAIGSAGRPEEAHRIIQDALGPMAQALDRPALERLRQFAAGRMTPAGKSVPVTMNDLKGALAVFLLVFASTFPVVLPFIFAIDLQFAMRLSAAIAIVMMYLCGHQWGRYAGQVPWRAGVVLVLMGVFIEAVVIALGG
jgi:hypothetical protein